MSMSQLVHLVDSALSVEHGRVQSQVRQSHLVRNGVKTLVASGRITSKQAKDILKMWKAKRVVPADLKEFLCDSETDELVRRQLDLENYVDGLVAVHIKDHPDYGWFSRVKGVGKENIGKALAPVRVKPSTKEVIWCSSCEKEVRAGGGELKKCPKCDSKLIFKVIDLPYADSVSALRMFAGFAPVDGHSMKRTKGEKLKYNSQLRSMCWRLASSLLRAKGKFYDYYLKEKEKYQERYRNEGKAIVPVTSLPKKDKKRYEPENMISEGHVHNQALRKMIQLFLACLWLTWREAEGLPATKPYAIDQLKHVSFIDPWEMVDR